MISILFSIVRICPSQLKCNCLKNAKRFLKFLFHFWNLHQILNILNRKVIIIANVFSKLQTVKILVKPLSKKLRFRTFFDSQHVKVSQTLVKSVWEHFDHIFWWLWEELIMKIPTSLICQILDVFVNTFIAEDKYPVSFSGLREFAAPNSNAIILKTENIFRIFRSISLIFNKC